MSATKMDPMGYTMEQLVRALANEAISEVSYDDSSPYDQEEISVDLWTNIAEAIIKEMDRLFEVHGQYYSEDLIEDIRHLLEPYSMHPAAHKFLGALEQTSANLGKDPRLYTTTAIQAIDSVAANDWADNHRNFR